MEIPIELKGLNLLSHTEFFLANVTIDLLSLLTLTNFLSYKLLFGAVYQILS